MNKIYAVVIAVMLFGTVSLTSLQNASADTNTPAQVWNAAPPVPAGSPNLAIISGAGKVHHGFQINVYHVIPPKTLADLLVPGGCGSFGTFSGAPLGGIANVLPAALGDGTGAILTDHTWVLTDSSPAAKTGYLIAGTGTTAFPALAFPQAIALQWNNIPFKPSYMYTALPSPAGDQYAGAIAAATNALIQVLGDEATYNEGALGPGPAPLLSGSSPYTWAEIGGGATPLDGGTHPVMAMATDTTSFPGSYVLVSCGDEDTSGFPPVPPDTSTHYVGTAEFIVIAPQVGGEVLSVDMIALLVAGASVNAYWILPMLGAIGATIGLTRLKRKKPFEE